MPEEAVLERPVTPPINPLSSAFESDDFLRGLGQAMKEDGVNDPELKVPEKLPEKKVEEPKVVLKDDKGKPAENKTSTDAKEDDEPDDIKKASEATQSSWKKLKLSKKTIEQERDKWKADYDKTAVELKTVREQADAASKSVPKELNLAENPEYLRIKKEAEEYSKRLEELDVERHPKFVAHFEGRINQQLEIAKRLAGDKGVDIMKLPPGVYRDEQIETLALELSPVKQAQLATVVTRMDEISMERSSEIARAKESYKTIKEQETMAEKSLQSQRENVFKTALTAASDNANGVSVYQPKDGDEEWNKALRERVQLAGAIYGGKLKPEDAANAALWSAAAPALLSLYRNEKASFDTQKTELTNRVQALEKEIQDLRVASPKPGGDNTVTDKRVDGPGGIDQLVDGASEFLSR